MIGRDSHSTGHRVFVCGEPVQKSPAGAILCVRTLIVGDVTSNVPDLAAGPCNGECVPQWAKPERAQCRLHEEKLIANIWLPWNAMTRCQEQIRHADPVVGRVGDMTSGSIRNREKKGMCGEDIRRYASRFGRRR